jgi:hypothetical protein
VKNIIVEMCIFWYCKDFNIATVIFIMEKTNIKQMEKTFLKATSKASVNVGK